MVRTSAALNGTPISYAYNTRNQLTSDGTHTVSYDKNGNRISDGTLSMVWDRAGRMLSHDGHSYACDGEGRRITQTAAGSTTRYVLDVQRGLPAVIGAKSGSNVTHYMHGPLGMFAQRNPDGSWDWMLHDGLRSVRGVFDGTLQSAAEYDPFGEPIVAPAGTAYGFTGELTDGNGLVYLRARYLAPSLGTFASRDPWRGSASAPRTWNGYAWVEGNVVNRVDPGGMAACSPNQQSGSSGVADVRELQREVHKPKRAGRPSALSCGPNKTINIDGGCEDAGGGQASAGNPGSGSWGGGWSSIIATIDLQAILIALGLAPVLAEALERLFSGVNDVIAQLSEAGVAIPLPNVGGQAGTAPQASATTIPDTDEQDRSYPITRDVPDQPDCHPIVWPAPIWKSLGINDEGVFDSTHDRPGPVLERRTRQRDTDVTKAYRQKNSVAIGETRGQIHHKWPLYLYGPDEPSNLVFLPLAEHTAWHAELRRQGVTGNMYYDPPGTKYCVVHHN